MRSLVVATFLVFCTGAISCRPAAADPKTNDDQLKRTCANIAALAENMAQQAHDRKVGAEQTPQYHDLVGRGLSREAGSIANFINAVKGDLTPSVTAAAVGYSCYSAVDEKRVFRAKKTLGKRCNALNADEQIRCIKNVLRK